MSTDPKPQTTIFVVDDHPLVREGLKMLAESAGDLHVVGSSGMASAALEPLQRLAPDVVLLDIDLVEEDGVEWLPRIRAAAPRASVLILTALRDHARDPEALRAGARGLVLKGAPPETLVQAIRTVASGGLWFDPAVLARRTPPPRSATASPSPTAGAVPAELAALTPRERAIVLLVGEGLRNEDVAKRLGITEKTVRNQLTGVFGKLKVSGRLELVVYLYEHGLAQRR